MEESFEVRVKRLFGSRLFETVPTSSFPSTSWSVTDGEVERREWNRERGGAPAEREDAPCSSAFYDEGGCFSKKPERSRDLKKEFEGDLNEPDDDGEEGGMGGAGDDADEASGDAGEREDREIRSSVGLDPTLDYEDEEDEYDRVALCKENAGERLYMRDVKDHGPYLNCHTAVPDLFEDSFEEVQFHRDPRADHFAARVRLKEDKQQTADSCPPLPMCTNGEPSLDLRVKIAEDDINLKPILKRKGGQINPKPKKRVRFDPGCKDGHDEEPQDFHAVPESMETSAVAELDSSLPEESHGVPDYIRNPSKYTHYTFDMSEKDDGETNKCAFEDFRNLVNRSNSGELQPDFPMELPKTVIFTPRKKAGDAMRIDDSSGFAQEDSSKESGQMLTCSPGVAEREAHDSEACEMEEDDVQTPMVEVKASAGARKDRRYRPKSTPEDSS